MVKIKSRLQRTTRGRCHINFKNKTFEKDNGETFPLLFDVDECLRLIGCSTSEFTLADYPPMDDRFSNEKLKSSGRLKQEVNNEQTSLFKI